MHCYTYYISGTVLVPDLYVLVSLISPKIHKISSEGTEWWNEQNQAVGRPVDMDLFLLHI